MHHWWMERQQELKTLAEETLPLLVYSEEILNEAFFDLLTVRSVERVFESAEAAPHPGILQTALKLGAGFQCTTLAEMQHLLARFPDLDPRCLLFVPARATREEYGQALKFGVSVVAGTEAWMSCPDIFERRPVFRRIRIRSDTLTLEKSVSAFPFEAAGIYLEIQGRQIPPVDLKYLIPALHERAGFLPDRHALCLGGGIGLPIHPERDSIMIPTLSDQLDDIVEHYAGLRIWVEPGRHLISHAGILLVRGTNSRGNDGKNGGRLNLLKKLMGRCAAEGILSAMYTLTGPDLEPQSLIRGATGGDSPEGLWKPGFLSSTQEEDIFLITNQGGACAHAEGVLGSVAKHVLKARRICQVKL